MTDDEADDGSRSERLRRRRQSQRDRASDADAGTDPDTAAPNDASSSEPSKPSEPSEPVDPSVKDEQVGTYMYLPESQKKELERLYNVLKADYEYEYDQEFEKNRHFYPLVVDRGLDGLQEVDASEIHEHLQSR